MIERGEIDGTSYRWSGAERRWGTFTVGIPFEWVIVDETGVSRGPIRRREIIGGRLDGARMPLFMIEQTR